MGRALLKRGLPAARVNHWQARRFAEAAGRPVKTNPVDAAMLSSMAAVGRDKHCVNGPVVAIPVVAT